MGTFSVPKHFVDDKTEIGISIVETGVGPYVENEDYISFKAYYQWVPFMLFLQGIMFYIPHVIYKAFEGGKIKSILDGLNRWVLDEDERVSKEQTLSDYVLKTRGTHVSWALSIACAHLIYLANVVFQMFFTDLFLGYQFSKYGIKAASIIENHEDDRIDPMSRVFPRMTKCTFLKYGPSGSIQKHDAQCILPINIINEKIYVFLWFWFGFLAILTVIDLIWNYMIVSSPKARKIIMKRKLRLK